MKQEGFWRPHETDQVSGLPWPQAGEPWEDVSRVAGQSAFPAKLAVVEAHAASAGYRGGTRAAAFAAWRTGRAPSFSASGNGRRGIVTIYRSIMSGLPRNFSDSWRGTAISLAT